MSTSSTPLQETIDKISSHWFKSPQIPLPLTQLISRYLNILPDFTIFRSSNKIEFKIDIHNQISKFSLNISSLISASTVPVLLVSKIPLKPNLLLYPKNDHQILHLKIKKIVHGEHSLCFGLADKYL